MERSVEHKQIVVGSFVVRKGKNESVFYRVDNIWGKDAILSMGSTGRYYFGREPLVNLELMEN